MKYILKITKKEIEMHFQRLTSVKRFTAGLPAGKSGLQAGRIFYQPVKRLTGDLQLVYRSVKFR